MTNAIEINGVFAGVVLADYAAIGGGYTAREEVSVVTGGQYCVTVSETRERRSSRANAEKRQAGPSIFETVS